MNEARKCNLDSCADPAVICFTQQELCLPHFLSRCYEDLNRFDVRAHGSQVSHSGPAGLKDFVEECSRCALEVSLKCQHLDNLQRGRLLDILLWASELLPKSSVVVRETHSRVLEELRIKESYLIDRNDSALSCEPA